MIIRQASLRGRLLVVVAILSGLLSPSSLAQRPARRPVALESYVPVTSQIFVSIKKPRDVDLAMKRAHAWRLIPMLTGSTVESGMDLSLRAALIDFLGPDPTVDINEMLNSELGLIASSWSSFDRATWVVRPPDRDTLSKWFPVLSKGTERRFYGAEAGIVVCAHDDCALLNRGGGAMFGSAMALLAGHKAPSLHRDAMYRDLAGYLPSRPLATAYLRRDPSDKGPLVLGLPAAIDRSVIGMYEGQGRIDFAMRASLAENRASPMLEEATLARLLSLPATTMLAAGLTPAWDSAGATESEGTTAEIQRLATLLRGMHGMADGQSFDSLGPQWVFAWDQDFRQHSSAPQVAAMCPCADSKAVEGALTGMFHNIRGLVQALERDVPPTSLPVLGTTTHLGVPISHISMIEYAEHSQFPIARLLAQVEPSWAFIGDWLVVTLSRDHLERIIDAYRGLIPRLDTVKDVAAVAKRKLKRSSLIIVQADLAAEVIREWLSDLKKGQSSILQEQFWQAGAAQRKQRRLGIGMATDQQPGVVTVARVYAGTAADGAFESGDRILGVDGALLDLSSPNQDLRRRWLDAGDQSGVRVFRIERSGTGMDVTLTTVQSGGQPTIGAIRPDRALRELAVLASSVEFASFASYVSQPDRYSARVSLRFKPGRPRP